MSFGVHIVASLESPGLTILKPCITEKQPPKKNALVNVMLTIRGLLYAPISPLRTVTVIRGIGRLNI